MRLVIKIVLTVPGKIGNMYKVSMKTEGWARNYTCLGMGKRNTKVSP